MTESSTPQPKLPWRRAKVVFNTDALAHNLNKVREYAADSKVMAVIKANAYGHGMLLAAQSLDDADMFAVAMPEEAFALRASGCAKPIIVLHGFANVAELEQFSELGLSSVVHQQLQIDCLLATSLSKPIDCWLKVDTGMHRLGVELDKAVACYKQLDQSESVSNVFLMSHFANADELNNSLNNSQLNNFIKVNSDINVLSSMANSAAIMRLPQSHFDVVRPGIMLYGASPFSSISATELGLQAVMQFESVLIDIKQVKAGESIGYGGVYTCEEDMTVGIVAAGYGDGYPRHAKNGTPVWLNNNCCGLLGRVSMDSLCIDLTKVKASIGDRVVLWGAELSVDEIAHCSESIAYELLCNAGAVLAKN